MADYRRRSTGHRGVDAVIDDLRLGDNVVWQTDQLSDFTVMVRHFVRQAKDEGRRVVYIRFAHHEPLLEDQTAVKVYTLDPTPGFESFATEVHRILSDEGEGVYYVFDSLTDLLDRWCSDLMVMNFFKVTCPYLYELDTIAYFCLLRSQHTFETVAGIRETTQLLLDLHHVNDATYVHAHKVWSRYSPTMFFPHRVDDSNALPVTSSEETSRLFGRVSRQREPQDRWRRLIDRGYEALSIGDAASQEESKSALSALLLGRTGRMVDLATDHLSLSDLLAIADREIGTGYIGGKSVGMLAARAIVGADPDLASRLEAHDSFYLGSDLFLTYIIANGWWKLWMAQKTPSGYYTVGAQLYDLLGSGQFPPSIRERFLRLLEYFGQSPIIVRSSSLLEDNFGNAFAGKYESTFCANQGSPEQRLRAFENAVRAVYSSAMSNEALRYRENRLLSTNDEQMAVLVQRVSGDHHDDLFFPHAGGVGHSHNQYVFGPDLDPSVGALRLVVGLGTRAVDHLTNDYARIVSLDQPLRSAVALDDVGKFAQRLVDVLSIPDNDLITVPLQSVSTIDMDWSQFISADYSQIRWLREMGRTLTSTPIVCDFKGLLSSDFSAYMSKLLRRLADAYDYPVDIEFTVNQTPSGEYRVCLVQCRPLQTRGIGDAVTLPELDSSAYLMTAEGGFMGGNVQLPIDTVVFVKPEQYLQLELSNRYAVARQLGELNEILSAHNTMMIGPGRWGTSTTELGVPVHFAEIDRANVLVEITDPSLDFVPDLSFGSHFFQDLVESGIFFATIDQSRPSATFQSDLVTSQPNLLTKYLPDSPLSQVIHVAQLHDLMLYSDVVAQRMVCAITPTT